MSLKITQRFPVLDDTEGLILLIVVGCHYYGGLPTVYGILYNAAGLTLSLKTDLTNIGFPNLSYSNLLFSNKYGRWIAVTIYSAGIAKEFLANYFMSSEEITFLPRLIVE
ncbi:hypothetical protein GQX74_002010 [Glossina fuscipes]|nr:hypothetical protein GQX74_002010 [Glossina fuscipes]